MKTTVHHNAHRSCGHRLREANADESTGDTEGADLSDDCDDDPAKNTVNLDNKEVPGRMMAMKMDYELRGAKVAELARDGTLVEVTVHDTNGAYYITDVKQKK